jgi:hypothetical protein
LLSTPVFELTQGHLSKKSRQLWLWPNLLSLDAPLVAALWNVLLTVSCKQSLSVVPVAVLTLTVWLIYLGDRILDSFASAAPIQTKRHAFHKRHWRILTLLSIAICLVNSSLLPFLPPALIRHGLTLTVLVAMYMSAVHLPPAMRKWRLPKELLVGILFAAGTSLAPLTFAPGNFSLGLGILLFAALCTLNCSAIENWESRFGVNRFASPPHPLATWMGRHVQILSAGICVISVIVFFVSQVHLLLGSVALSALGFLWLAAEQSRFSLEELRVLADVPLLSPILVFGVHLLARSGL